LKWENRCSFSKSLHTVDEESPVPKDNGTGRNISGGIRSGHETYLVEGIKYLASYATAAENKVREPH